MKYNFFYSPWFLKNCSPPSIKDIKKIPLFYGQNLLNYIFNFKKFQFLHALRVSISDFSARKH